MFEIKALYYEFSSAHDLGLHQEIPTITFRGAFGYALAQVVAREACLPKLESQVAVYRRFFMPQNDGSENSRNHDLARPFVIRGFYSRPDRRCFLLEILLFGKACEHETFFDRVVEVMSYMGIGKYKRICHFEKLNSRALEIPEMEVTDRLAVHFMTPCSRLKHDGRLYEDHIPFNALMPRLVDRLIELDNLYGDRSFAAEWNIAEMKKNSCLIAGSVENGGKYAARRRSGRTKQEMSLSGFLGTMLYEGDFRPFLEPLRYLPYVNIGRFNVFGCGWCTLEFV